MINCEFCLTCSRSSPAYREQLVKSRIEQRVKVAEGVEAFMPDDRSTAETGSTWGVVNVAASSEGGDITQELRMSSSRKPLVISKFTVYLHWLIN